MQNYNQNLTLKESMHSIKANHQLIPNKMMEDYEFETVKAAFLEYNSMDKPFEQLLEVCDSLFLLLDVQECLPDHLKKMLWQLFKNYSIYKALLIHEEEGCEV